MMWAGKIVLLIAVLVTYIYFTGYGIGYFTGSQYRSFSEPRFQVLLNVLEVLKWIGAFMIAVVVIKFIQKSKQK